MLKMIIIDRTQQAKADKKTLLHPDNGLNFQCQTKKLFYIQTMGWILEVRQKNSSTSRQWAEFQCQTNSIGDNLERNISLMQKIYSELNFNFQTTKIRCSGMMTICTLIRILCLFVYKKVLTILRFKINSSLGFLTKIDGTCFWMTVRAHCKV